MLNHLTTQDPHGAISCVGFILYVACVKQNKFKGLPHKLNHQLSHIVCMYVVTVNAVKMKEGLTTPTEVVETKTNEKRARTKTTS